MNEGKLWRLYHRGELVGEIEEQGHDFPWTYGRFRPRPGVEPLRILFADYTAAVDAGDAEAMERAYEAIRRVVTMTDPSGAQVAEFMLNIDGDEARYRWHNEPFAAE